MRPSVRRIEGQYHDQVNFHILNVDQPSTTPLAVEHQVTAIPLIVLLNADGSVYQRLVGYQTEDQLRARMEDLLAANS